MATEDQEPARTDVSADVRSKVGMAVESLMFLGLTVFFAVAAAIYGSLVGGDEPAGFVALILTAGLTLIIGTFLRFSGRRLEGPRPEDRGDAEVSDGAGDLGFFSPGSYWPFTLALAAAATAYALALWQVWLMIICIGFLLLAICGLLFEYHKKPHAH